MSTGHDEKQETHKLIELVREVIGRDNQLREEFQVGDKFRFVRDRLQALLDQLEKHMKSNDVTAKVAGGVVEEDEVVVYVYLFNAQGLVLNSWLNMLTPKLFYEYSVNRPAYTEKAYIEALIRSKTNKNQHAYLSVAAKKKDIEHSLTEKKDVVGNPIVKIREGGLQFDRLVAFTHMEMDYTLDGSGQLVKKIH
jgi:hypothetical protein